MKLEGSCHCGAVRFSVESRTPCPYLRCYCSICRKTAGGGGFAVNIMGEAASLALDGADALRVYRARGADGKPSRSRRHFCGNCASALWIADPRWPEWIYPFASAIDTPLPAPGAREHIFVDAAAPWVAIPEGPDDPHFAAYPELSIENWHEAHGLSETDATGKE